MAAASMIVLAVVGALAASTAQADKPPGFPFVNPRLMASAMRIWRLEREIKQLRHEIDDAEKIDPLGFVLEMHARLDRVEGSPCRPNHVQCGWQSTDCVSNMVVCDGQEDCYNGWDESQQVCSHGPIRAGNVFSGIVRWWSCKPWRETHTSIKITGVKTSKYFPSRLGVTAHFITDLPDRLREGDLEGVYILAEKRLILVPDRQHQGEGEYSPICDFNHGDDETADCQVVSEASMFKCADLRISLEHEDTHHTRHRGADHQHHDDHGVDHRGETVEHHYDIEGHDHPEHHD